MQKNYQGLQAATALDALKDDGIDPNPFFETVANSLLRHHGRNALVIAADAIARFGMSGDREGRELWQEVSKSLWAKANDDFAPAGEALH